MTTDTQLPLALDDDQAGATFGPDRVYRYRLWRRWADGPTVCWVMLNPSTADEATLDPTIRRCVGFSRAWGYGALEVVNLFALRSTDPAGLYDHPAPIGPDNDRHIAEADQACDLTVCAWGVHGELAGRGADVLEMLGRPMALRLTKDGHPNHPLYLPADLQPFEL